jgi:hypothetical protein
MSENELADLAERFELVQRARILNRHGASYDRALRARDRWDGRWEAALLEVWRQHLQPRDLDALVRAGQAAWGDVEKAVWREADHPRDLLGRFTEKQLLGAIGRYMHGGDQYGMNESLRRGRDPSKEAQKLIAAIEGWGDKPPKELYRRVSTDLMPEDLVRRLRTVGEEVTDHGITSTSGSRSGAEYHGDLELRLSVKRGVRGLHLASKVEPSIATDKEEWLLPPGIRIRVRRVKKDTVWADLLPPLTPVEKAFAPRLLQAIGSAVKAQLGSLFDFARGAMAVYMSLAHDMSEDAGQHTLDQLGLNETFRWTSVRDMPRDPNAVRGSKVIQHAYGRHIEQLRTSSSTRPTLGDPAPRPRSAATSRSGGTSCPASRSPGSHGPRSPRSGTRPRSTRCRRTTCGGSTCPWRRDRASGRPAPTPSARTA